MQEGHISNISLDLNRPLNSAHSGKTPDSKYLFWRFFLLLPFVTRPFQNVNISCALISKTATFRVVTRAPNFYFVIDRRIGVVTFIAEMVSKIIDLDLIMKRDTFRDVTFLLITK